MELTRAPRLGCLADPFSLVEGLRTPPECLRNVSKTRLWMGFREKGELSILIAVDDMTNPVFIVKGITSTFGSMHRSDGE